MRVTHPHCDIRIIVIRAMNNGNVEISTTYLLMDLEWLLIWGYLEEVEP